MLKKFLSVFYIVMIVCICNVASAELAYDYGFYTVTSPEVVSQSDEKIVFCFDIKNNTSNYYSELYAVPAIKIFGNNEYKKMYFKYYELNTAQFSLEPNATKKVSVSCDLPKDFPNRGSVITFSIQAKTHKIPSFNEFVEIGRIKATFDGFLDGTPFSYWKLENGDEVIAGTGPNVTMDEMPKMKVVLKSSFSEDIKVYPVYDIYERSPIYNSKPVYTYKGDAITFEAGKEKEILIDVPGMAKPESYLAKLRFVDKSGRIVSNLYDYRFVMVGDSATVSKIALEEVGDKKLVKGYIYGPASGDTLNNVVAEIFINDINGALIEKTEKTISVGQELTEVEMEVPNWLEGKINAAIKVSKNGKELYCKDVDLDLGVSFSDKNSKFTDIEGTKYEEAVYKLNSLGIINGYPDNTFKPENLITRAEVSSILTKLAEIELTNDEPKFYDISNHWAKDYINAIYGQGVVSGYPDGTFKPQNNITYGEAFTMMLNLLGYRDEVSKIEINWPYNYAEQAALVGLTSELEAFDSMKPINRGNIALLTLKAYMLKNEK